MVKFDVAVGRFLMWQLAKKLNIDSIKVLAPTANSKIQTSNYYSRLIPPSSPPQTFVIVVHGGFKAI